MNAKRLIISALALAALCAVSCKPNETPEEEVKFTVTPTEITVDSLATEATVRVVSNNPWTVEIAGTDSWVTADPMSGDATEGLDVKLNMTQNLAAEGAVSQDRTANITFRVDAENSVVVKLTQKRGEPAENEEPKPEPEPGETKDNPIVANIGEFKKGTDSLWYQLTGEIYSINDSENGEFDLKDVTGKVEVWYMVKEDGAEVGSFQELGLNEGDIVTLIGMKDADGTVIKSWYVSHFRPVVASLAEVVAASAAEDVWYKVSGAISEITDEETGIVKLADGESAITVAGVTMTKEDENDHSFAYLGLKVTDTLTLIGTRTADGIGGPAFYHSHTEYVEPKEPENPTDIKAVTIGEFIDSEPDQTTWYELTGEICSAIKTTSTNFSMKDDSGEVGVSQLVMSKGASADQNAFNELNLKKGDKIKIHATHKEMYGSHIAAGPAYFIEIVERAPEEVVEPINETLTFVTALKNTDEDTGEVSYAFYFNDENVVIDITPNDPESFVGEFVQKGEDADGVINGAYSKYNKYGFTDGTKCVITQDGENYNLTLEGKWKKNEAPITLKYTGPITLGTLDDEGGDVTPF